MIVLSFESYLKVIKRIIKTFEGKITRHAFNIKIVLVYMVSLMHAVSLLLLVCYGTL